MTLMVGLTAYLLGMIQSLYIHCILILICILYTYVQLSILPTYGYVLYYSIEMNSLSDTIYIMYITLFHRKWFYWPLYATFPFLDKALVLCSLTWLWYMSSL